MAEANQSVEPLHDRHLLLVLVGVLRANDLPTARSWAIRELDYQQPPPRLPSSNSFLVVCEKLEGESI